MDNYGFRFREWTIYRDARSFRVEINKLLVSFPREERYALVDQTKRALNSIVLNIAESANKNSDKDTRLFINRAHCSLDEVVACLDCALDDGYIVQKQHVDSLREALALGKQFKGFSLYLSRSSGVTPDKGLVVKGLVKD